MIFQRVVAEVSPTVGTHGYHFNLELPAGCTNVASVNITGQDSNPSLIWAVLGISVVAPDAYSGVVSVDLWGTVYDASTQAAYAGGTPVVYVEFLATDQEVAQVSYTGEITNLPPG